MRIAKKVSDTPCGGQIIMSGESLAQIASLKDLKSQESADLFSNYCVMIACNDEERPLLCVGKFTGCSRCSDKTGCTDFALSGSAQDRNGAHRQLSVSCISGAM